LKRKQEKEVHFFWSNCGSAREMGTPYFREIQVKYYSIWPDFISFLK